MSVQIFHPPPPVKMLYTPLLDAINLQRESTLLYLCYYRNDETNLWSNISCKIFPPENQKSTKIYFNTKKSANPQLKSTVGNKTARCAVSNQHPDKNLIFSILIPMRIEKNKSRLDRLKNSKGIILSLWILYFTTQLLYKLLCSRNTYRICIYIYVY